MKQFIIFQSINIPFICVLMDLGGDVSTAAVQGRNVTRETRQVYLLIFDANFINMHVLRLYNFFIKIIYQIKKHLYSTEIVSLIAAKYL